MAELEFLGFRSGTSFLHHLDIRFKLCGLAAVNLASIQAGFWGLCLLFFLLQAAFFATGIPMLKALKEMRYFLFLILFVFLSRALSTPGSSLGSFGGLTITEEGLISGVYIAWRLWLIVISGILFVNTSQTVEIKAAVQWYLKPVPFVPEKRVGVILSLMIRFLPFILEIAKETAEAQKSRGIENRKNPIYRIRVFVLPLMRRLFENADNLIMAMEARSYTENRTDPRLTSNRKDWLILIITLCICLTAFQL